MSNRSFVMADSPRSLVRVVVPVYRELTPDEESSLRNNVRVLVLIFWDL